MEAAVIVDHAGLEAEDVVQETYVRAFTQLDAEKANKFPCVWHFFGPNRIE